jgi:hypothetical protein
MKRGTVVIHQNDMGDIVGVYVDDDAVRCVLIDERSANDDDGYVGELFVENMAQLGLNFEGAMVERIDGIREGCA